MYFLCKIVKPTKQSYFSYVIFFSTDNKPFDDCKNYDILEKTYLKIVSTSGTLVGRLVAFSENYEELNDIYETTMRICAEAKYKDLVPTRRISNFSSTPVLVCKASNEEIRKYYSCFLKKEERFSASTQDIRSLFKVPSLQSISGRSAASSFKDEDFFLSSPSPSKNQKQNFDFDYLQKCFPPKEVLQEEFLKQRLPFENREQTPTKEKVVEKPVDNINQPQDIINEKISPLKKIKESLKVLNSPEIINKMKKAEEDGKNPIPKEIVEPLKVLEDSLKKLQDNVVMKDLQNKIESRKSDEQSNDILELTISQEKSILEDIKLLTETIELYGEKAKILTKKRNIGQPSPCLHPKTSSKSDLPQVDNIKKSIVITDSQPIINIPRVEINDDIKNEEKNDEKIDIINLTEIDEGKQTESLSSKNERESKTDNINIKTDEKVNIEEIKTPPNFKPSKRRFEYPKSPEKNESVYMRISSPNLSGISRRLFSTPQSGSKRKKHSLRDNKYTASATINPEANQDDFIFNPENIKHVLDCNENLMRKIIEKMDNDTSGYKAETIQLLENYHHLHRLFFSHLASQVEIIYVPKENLTRTEKNLDGKIDIIIEGIFALDYKRYKKVVDENKRFNDPSKYLRMLIRNAFDKKMTSHISLRGAQFKDSLHRELSGSYHFSNDIINSLINHCYRLADRKQYTFNEYCYIREQIAKVLWQISDEETKAEAKNRKKKEESISSCSSVQFIESDNLSSAAFEDDDDLSQIEKESLASLDIDKVTGFFPKK